MLNQISCPASPANPAKLALAAILGAAVASATPAAHSAEEPSVNDIGLAEIVVTARKRAENLQETPVAVAVLTADELVERGITNLRDLSVNVPTFAWQPATGGGTSSGQYFIRGIGQWDFSNTTDPSIGLYVDGVYIARTIGAAIDMGDIESVQVLKGPQGTLFGRNAIGGAVLVTTRQPESTRGGYARLTLGSRNRADIEGSLNLPMSDTLNLRVSGQNLNQDGYAVRTFTGERTGSVDSSTFRGHLAWRPAEDWRVTLSVDRTRRRQTSGTETIVAFNDNDPLVQAYNAAFLAPAGLPVMSAANFQNENPYRSSANARPGETVDSGGASVTVDWDLGVLEVKSITAVRTLESSFAFDFDGTPYPFSDESIDEDQRQLTQELQVNGNSFGDRLAWTVGAFYFRETSRQNFDLLFFDERVNQGTLFDTRAVLPNPSPFNFTTLTDNDMENRSIAVYGQSSFRLKDTLSLTTGIRYTSEKKALRTTSRGPSGFIYINDSRNSDEWTNVSPRLGLDLRLTDDAMLYASAARGFRSGGFNSRSFGDFRVLSPFNPEDLWAYEVGAKTEWLDQRVRLNVAAFYYDYAELQVTEQIPNSPLIKVGNAAEVRVTGGEVELVMQPTRSISGSLSVAHISESFRKVGENATVVSTETELPAAPEWSASATLGYEVPIGSWGALTLRADAYHRTGTYFLFDNSPDEYQSGYTLLNGRVELRPTTGSWVVALFGKNLTDKAYRTVASDSVGFGDMTVAGFGRPREWGLTLEVGF